MSQIGRISGPLLFSNLERNGVDLAFRNDLDTTELLFLDVNNNKIGINTDSPGVTFRAPNQIRTSGLISQSLDTPGYNIDSNTIAVSIGDINLNAGEAVVFAALENGSIRIDDNKISTLQTDQNIDIVPNAAGETNIENKLNVNGNIYTPSNITLEGSITFGDNQNQDTVTFESELDSDLVPDEDAGSLGSLNKRWRDLYTRLVNGQTITTTNIVAGDLDYTLRQGNVFFVDVNGSDSNSGDHLQDPFRTVKRALEAADASIQGPVSIMIGAGEFQEELPLEISSNVTVSGYDIRNTIIKPAPGFEINDVFLLDGATTVQNLTVSEFYSDTTERYAFRFRPNAVISGRYPYIQNVTVLTYGSNRTSTDPRGFASGDAGSGAFVDGAEVHANSPSAAMLFQSVTFLTPNANGLVMTNGARVEWLSSFTYFADKGLFAFNGATGRVSEDGSTINFGAELRSIGSANVYGNQAAIADGDDCLFYLVNHNFAYVGTGRRADNDSTLAIKENEVIKLNGGQIVFTSIDETGKYKVGDTFFVDFELGTTTLDSGNIIADSFTQLNFVDGDSETLVNSNQVRTGLIDFRNNNLTSLSGSIELSAENDLNLHSNTDIKQNLSMTGNFSFDGSLNLLGNETSDTVQFNVDINQDFLPKQDSKFNLGTSTKEWSQVWLSEASVDSVSINDNYIQTVESNSNLEFRTNGTGRIISRNSVKIDKNLSVAGTSSLQQTSFKNITLEKELANIGNNTITGTVNVGKDLTVVSGADLENISIIGNAIITRESNSDLEFRANSVGKVIFPDNSVDIRNNLHSDVTNSFSDINTVLGVESPRFTISDIFIDTNYIETTNNDLELKANGTGYVSLETIDFIDNILSTQSQDVVFSPNQDLEIQSTGSIQIPVGDTDYVGPTGSIRFDSTDQVFEGFTPFIVPFGGIFSADRQTSVTIDPAVPEIDFIADNQSVGSIDSTGLTVINASIDDININNNQISTTIPDSNLVFDMNGVGEFSISDMLFRNRTITNTRNNGLLTFDVTDFGSTKFNTSTGVVIPFGDTASQDSSPPEGDLRYNTETNLMEVYNGADYVAAAGTSATISEADYNELVELYTLILG